MSSFSDALQAAQSHLDAAQFCFEHNREGLSASEAYYAMYHAVRAWALQEEGDAPGTHKGMGLFVHRRVEQGRLGPALRDQFHDARAARERWHYQSLDPLSTVETEALVTAADTLLEKVRAR